MAEKQKLELTWIGKNEELKLEPRILIEDPDKSYGDKNTENLLIHGDNLLALKALEQDYTGRIKCIYIDPPYNTGNAFEHYDDGLEHSIWLNLMKERLDMLRNLLSDDGIIYVQIDDSEGAYLKVLMDEIFGRINYVVTFYVQVRYGNKTLNEDNDYQKLIEQVLVYKKNSFKPNKEKIDYSIDKFCWKISELTEGEKINLGNRDVIIFKDGEYTIEQIEPSISGLKETWATGSLVKQGGSAAEFFDLYLSDRKYTDGLGTLYKVIDLGTKGDGLGYRYISGPKKDTATKGKFYTGVPIEKVDEIKNGSATKEKPIENFLDFAGNFGNCRLEGGVSFNGGKKPEALISKIIEMSTKEGDIILDSFLGSGTTIAVAHKMKRRWIGIELGDQCYTHCHTRLKNVIDGDQSGVSKLVDWKSGGGFKFYELAPSLLKKDKYDNWVIDENYNADLLASAVAKHEGFNYSPDSDIFWKQGKSTETDYIFTTTTFINTEYLDRIASEMKEDESLLICCKNFQQQCDDKYSNITIKKIPQMLLGKCEFGKEDYSLNIINYPYDESDELCDEDIEEEILEKELDKKNTQTTLF